MSRHKLGDLIEIRHGYAFSGQHFCADGPFVLLTPGNFYDAGGFKFRADQKHYDGPAPSDFVLNEGDLLVAMTEQGEGLLGSAAFVPSGKKCLHNQRLGLVSPKAGAEVDLRYVYYLLNSQNVRQQIRATASGAKVRHTSPNRIYAVTVPEHSIETQCRIASILGAYDDLIEVNRRRIALLEEMARRLFEEWFVRFRFPGHEAVPILDTPDGPLPEGWKWEPFSALADFINGFAFKPSHFEEEGLPIVKIPELKNGVSTKTPRNCGKDVPQRLHIKDGDLLFSWSGTFAISEWTCGDALLNQHLFLVPPKREWGRGFIKEALIAALPKFDSQGVGATMKHIRRAALDQTVVAIPSSPSLIDCTNKFFDAQYAQLVALRQSNQRLVASRNLLLPRLISGQLSVTDVESQLKEAA